MCTHGRCHTAGADYIDIEFMDFLPADTVWQLVLPYGDFTIPSSIDPRLFFLVFLPPCVEVRVCVTKRERDRKKSDVLPKRAPQIRERERERERESGKNVASGKPFLSFFLSFPAML